MHKKHGVIYDWAMPAVVLLLAGYLLVSLFHNQTVIGAKQRELTDAGTARRAERRQSGA